MAHLNVFPEDRLSSYLFLGELALDGRIKPGKGTLASALLARKLNYGGIVIPKKNAKEAALVQDIDVFALDNLIQVVQLLNDADSVAPECFDRDDLVPKTSYDVDFQEIQGQLHVKRALEVAAAGAHNAPVDRTTRGGEDHAGQATSHHPSPYDLCRDLGDHPDL